MKWIKTWWVVLLGILVANSVAWLVLSWLQPPETPVRAIWVTRVDYTMPEDVRSIVNNVAAAGFTDVFFQIRGNATAFYKSRLEPWADELSGKQVGKLGNDPGWDPLQLALDTARPHGLRVHAYMNVLAVPRGISSICPPAISIVWSFRVIMLFAV